MKKLIRITFIFMFVTFFCKESLMGQNIPRPEHPRPDFKREQWLNLNGTWIFMLDEKDAGRTDAWETKDNSFFNKTITVPFSIESRLSGIGKTDFSGAAWYRREFSVPAEWNNENVWLNFGAVDWQCDVWINEKKAGSNADGYSPFSLNISGMLNRGANTVTVRIFDDTDTFLPTGKQVGWYTHTSGIWQTVWLEARPDSYIESFAVYPDIDQKKARIDIKIDGMIDKGGTIEIVPDKGNPESASGMEQVSVPLNGSSVSVTVPFSQVMLWEPETPNLYFYRLRIKKGTVVVDEVSSYLGMRKVHKEKAPGRDYEYLYLNNHPIYLRGALNQSFNPEGVYTFPSDEMIKNDMLDAKKFGFNFLRTHIKVEDPRYLYWADKTGIILMSDMPCFRNLAERSKEAWKMELDRMIARDFNHPSIFYWCLFNETWGLENQNTKEGQQWVKEMYEHAKLLDPTRLVEDNSACNYDHVVTDINSFHFYINDYDRVKKYLQNFVDQTYPGGSYNYIGGWKQTNVPFINSEYGGISAGSGDRDISWCLKYLTNEQRLHDKICGYIYTELMDIEWEFNGMMNYDRSPKEFGYEDVAYAAPGHEPFSYRDILRDDFIDIDSPPCTLVKTGENLSIDLFSCHYSQKDFNNTVLKWNYDVVDRNAVRHSALFSGTSIVPFKEYTVEKIKTLTFAVPPVEGVGTLTVWVEDENGGLIARNYINFEVFNGRSSRLESGDKTCILRFSPSTVTDASWGTSGKEGILTEGKIYGYKAGHNTYELNLPEAVISAGIRSITISAEMNAKARDGRQGWKERYKVTDLPQTDGTKYPSNVTISVNGIEAGSVLLPDDPADARGVLSHFHNLHPGSYGELVRFTVPKQLMEKISKRLAGEKVMKLTFTVKGSAEHPGGLAIYGERNGRYAYEPRVTITTEKEFYLKKETIDRANAVSEVIPVITPAPDTWKMMGPLPFTDRSDFEKSYRPEQDFTANEPVTVSGQKYSWEPVTPEIRYIDSLEGKIPAAWFDFTKIFDRSDHALVYLRTNIIADEAFNGKIMLGSDDGYKVWLNGELLDKKDVYRGCAIDDDIVAAHFKKGENILQIRINQEAGGWRCAVRITDKSGSPAKLIKFGL